METLLIKFAAYVMFGFSMEVFFVAIAKLTDGTISKEDEKLEGHTYLWMVPIYGLLLLFLFEPLHGIIRDWFILFRYAIWAILISSFEALSGFIYDKWLGFCPWDYSRYPDKVFARGYTRWKLVPLWGVAGLVIEKYSDIVISLVKCGN